VHADDGVHAVGALMAEFVSPSPAPAGPGSCTRSRHTCHQAGCNVLDSQQLGDRIAGRFFMRVHVETVPSAPATCESLYGGFAPVAAEFGMEWELHDTAVEPRGADHGVQGRPLP
jgi:formyltetrahydrofolate hydrolase